MGKPTITWGCDPEFFGYSTNGEKPVKSYDYPIGDKGKSTPIEGVDGWGVLADGCTFEFNTTRVYDDPIEMRDHLFMAMEKVERDLQIVMDYSRDFLLVPTEWTGDTVLNTIGCDPDNCAIQHGKARKRLTPDDFVLNGGKVWRGAGCHLHIGIDPWPEIPKHAFVRLLDALYQNIWRLPEANDMSCKYRRAGLYRSKSYGIEYRTPGHEWVRSENDELYMLNSKLTDLVEILSNSDSPEFNALVGIYQRINAEDQARLAMERRAEMFFVPPTQRLEFWDLLVKYENKKMRELQDEIIANAARGGLRVAVPPMYVADDYDIRNPE